MNSWRIRLFFSNTAMLMLPDVRSDNPGWRDSQCLPIEKMLFDFEGVDQLSKQIINFSMEISGMEKYNFFVEAMQNVITGSTKVQSFWFLGKLFNSTAVRGFHLAGSGLSEVKAVFGKEFRGSPTSGWKTGVVGKPICRVIRG
jgi:hypothetical protein